MFYQYRRSVVSRYSDTLPALSPPAREAEIFKKTLEEIPVSIETGDLFACRYGSLVPEPVPECPDFPEKAYFTETNRTIQQALDRNCCIWGSFGKGHTCIDYGSVLRQGLKHYIEKAEARLKAVSAGSRESEVLTAMLVSLRAAAAFSQRFAELAGRLLRQAGPGEEAERFSRILRALQKVPMNGAEDFFEAIQCVWLLHAAVPISEDCWASISLGRFDQYMHPYYIKSLENGESVEDLKKLLRQFFLMLDTYGDGACALNIGGCSEDDCDQMNALSEVLIDVEKECCFRAPIFAVRVNPQTPPELLDRLIDYKLFSVGQPTFYGELSCRRAVLERGADPGDATRFSVNSCMGLTVAGKEIADMWGCIFNSHLPLELAVNRGRPLNSPLPFATTVAPLDEIDSVEAVFVKYREYARELLSYALDYNWKSACEVSENYPNPFLSALTEHCIENASDRATGARYNTVTVETVALINTANAISAMDALVFKQRKYTLAQLIEAAKANYEECGELLSDLKKCAKYGQADAGADGTAARLMGIYAEVLKEFDHDNVTYLPSLHTLDLNVHYGNRLYATLDGRKKTVPVNKNAGPTNDARSRGLTDAILSAGSLPQYRYSGGQPIDLYFAKDLFADERNRQTIRQLVTTYFSMGGLQLQVNSVDIELLKKAYSDPRNHLDIIVRVGGYSVRFSDLDDKTKLEFISRFEAEAT